MADRRKTVLITGCSEGGIGAALAKEYQSRGYHVFASARNTTKIPSSLTSLPQVTVVALDITSSSSIAKAVQTVAATAPQGRLDVLVNNSGQGLTFPVLDTPIESARAIFDVNVFGLLAVTQAFTPLLMRSTDAVVVNNSSIAGQATVLYDGVYGASKAAVTHLSETMRLEVAPLGIRVVAVVTGIIETPFHANQTTTWSGLPASSYYAPLAKEIRAFMEGTERPGATPVDEYARQLVRRVEQGARGKVWIGTLGWLMQYVEWWMPRFVWDRIMVSTGAGGNKIWKIGEEVKQS